MEELQEETVESNNNDEIETFKELVYFWFLKDIFFISKIFRE